MVTSNPSNPSQPTDFAGSRRSDPAVPVRGTAAIDTGEIDLAGKRYLTTARLAGMLGVTVRTLARWHAMRVGPTRTKIGRLILIPVEKLPSWLESHAAVQPVRGHANLKR